MIERVARAIYEKRNGQGCRPWSIQTNSHKRAYLDDARAAIEAMREPTPKMVHVVAANWGRRTWSEYNEVIDAALQEPSK